MRLVLTLFDTASRSLSYFLGTLVIVLAIAAAASALEFREIAQWGLQGMGVTFLLLYGTLVLTALFCWTRLSQIRDDPANQKVWLEGGLHAANGVATLGLTYTLLGISLGIGSMAEHGVTPETVQSVIRELTKHFSLAFLTTVIGLPSSAALRALLLVTGVRLEADQANSIDTPQGDVS